MLKKTFILLNAILFFAAFQNANLAQNQLSTANIESNPMLAFNSFTKKKPTSNLIVKVHNIEKKQGIIWVGLYDSEQAFLDKEKATLVEGIDVTQIGHLEFKLKNLAYGTYAMALVHDENKNGTLDRNFIGIPTEPYGFSAKPKSKWRLPRFQEVKFDINAPKQTLNIELEKW